MRRWATENRKRSKVSSGKLMGYFGTVPVGTSQDKSTGVSCNGGSPERILKEGKSLIITMAPMTPLKNLGLHRGRNKLLVGRTTTWIRLAP